MTSWGDDSEGQSVYFGGVNFDPRVCLKIETRILLIGVEVLRGTSWVTLYPVDEAEVELCVLRRKLGQEDAEAEEDEWMNEWMDGWMDGWTDGRTDGRLAKV